MNHFANNGKEYLRKLKQVKQKKGDEQLTQEEIDILWSSMSDEEIDKKFGITRDRRLGCLITLAGTIIFWGILIRWATNSSRRSTTSTCARRVLRCCGAFALSMGLVSGNDGRGWLLFRFWAPRRPTSRATSTRRCCD